MRRFSTIDRVVQLIRNLQHMSISGIRQFVVSIVLSGTRVKNHHTSLDLQKRIQFEILEYCAPQQILLGLFSHTPWSFFYYTSLSAGMMKKNIWSVAQLILNIFAHIRTRDTWKFLLRFCRSRLV